jgi:flagellar hook assembly protein FlgD
MDANTSHSIVLNDYYQSDLNSYQSGTIRYHVQLQIFTISGKLVKTISKYVQAEGYRSDPIEWDGRDDFGDRIGRGVYIYRLKVRNSKGATAEKYEKLVILN